MAHRTTICPPLALAKGGAESDPLPAGRVLAIALKRHGVSERDAAAALGFGATEAHRWVTGEHRIDSDRLRRCLPEVFRTYHELQADSVPRAPRPPVSPTVRHLNASALHGKLAEELRAALADGSLSTDERRAVVLAALAAAEELRRLAADVLRGAA